MTFLTYTGRSDVRVLESRDLNKVGVEGFRRTIFHPNLPIELSDEVAQAILDNPDVFGNEFTEYVVSDNDRGSKVQENPNLEERGSNARTKTPKKEGEDQSKKVDED